MGFKGSGISGLGVERITGLRGSGSGFIGGVLNVGTWAQGVELGVYTSGCRVGI